MSAPVDPALPVSAAPRRPRAARRLFVDRITIPLLLLLTLIAGGLRFTALDRPTIWGDEALTYGRVAGTYQDLLDQLVTAMFTPLHYEMTWWVAQGLPYWGTIEEKIVERGATTETQRTFTPTHRIVEGGIKLTPTALRFIPALAGVLMVPAMYFLARQMFGPRVSLLAAGFACFSAYLLVYSRDAKMYSHFWLMCVLHVGCLLWWLRVRTPLAWLCWIAAGLAMIGLHALGGLVLVVCLVIFVTSSRQHLLGLLKLPMMLGWLLGWPLVLAYRWVQKKYTLIEWTSPLRYWQWGRVQWHRFRWPPVIFFAIGMIVIVRGPLMYYDGFNEQLEKAVGDDGTMQVGETGIGWVNRYNDGRSLDDLVLYTSSAYLTGWEWPRSQEANGVNDQALVSPRTLKLLQGSTIALLALLATGLLPWRRILQPARARLERITQDGRTFAPHVSRRTLWVGFWLIVPLYGVYTQSVAQPTTPLDAVSLFALKDASPMEWPRLTKPKNDQPPIEYYKSPEGWSKFSTEWRETFTRYRAMFQPEPSKTLWDRVAPVRVIALAAALVIGGAVLVWRWRALWRTTLRLLIAGVVIVLVCQVITIAPRFPDSLVWMPRYVGVVLPAFVLMAAVLVARQPTWWLRATTIALFVVVNLSQFAARTFGHSEPPTELMAADLLRSESRESRFRTYAYFQNEGPAPAEGFLYSVPGAYYLRELSGKPGDVRAIRHGGYLANFRTWRFDDPNRVVEDVTRARSPLQGFIVWSSIFPGTAGVTDPIADKLKGQFKRTEEQFWPVRDHWTWIERMQVRRRVYTRIAPPPEPPTPPPATAPAVTPPPPPAPKPTPPPTPAPKPQVPAPAPTPAPAPAPKVVPPPPPVQPTPPTPVVKPPITAPTTRRASPPPATTQPAAAPQPPATKPSPKPATQPTAPPTPRPTPPATKPASASSPTTQPAR